MPTVLEELKLAYPAFAIKKVSKTDIKKRAYVPNKKQRELLRRIGLVPGTEANPTMVAIREAGTDTTHQTTYYNSIRKEKGRKPEARMGRGLFEIIARGDEFMLATDDKEVFAHKIVDTDLEELPPDEIEDKVERVYEQVDPKAMLEIAKATEGKPARQKVKTMQFVRNLAVKQTVINRCEGKCEVPGCKYEGFTKDDGTKFIQVHHVVSLAEDGDDAVLNAIGICPNCHAWAHYGPDRVALAAKLLTKVAAAQKKYEASI